MLQMSSEKTKGNDIMTNGQTQCIIRALERLIRETHRMNSYLKRIADAVDDRTEHEATIIVDADEVRRFFDDTFEEKGDANEE